MKDFVKWTGEILGKIVLALEKKGMRNRVMRGKKGPQAVETRNAIFVGKKYFFQEHGRDKIVSVDRKILRHCDSERKRIVVYVLETGEFFEFVPSDYLANGYENERGDETLVSIDAGIYGRKVDDVSKVEPLDWA